jgi:PAS domain S-box-containing protein
MSAMASLGHESESKHFERLIDSIPSLVHTGKPDGYLDYFNQRWLQYLGVPMDDLLGWKWRAAIHPEDVEAIVDRWRHSLATGEAFLHEARVRRADGKYRWMMHHKVAARNESGQIVKWYGSSIDIEDRKQAEEQLRRSAEELGRTAFYLTEGQRLAHMGSWAFDPAGFSYWSPELFRIYGLNPASQPPSVQEYLDLVHGQDRESMANMIQGILAEPAPFDATKRIVRPDGEVRYIRCVGVPLVENQSLKKYVGSALDVTEHELLNQELRRREAYLAEAQRLSHTGSFGWQVSSGEIFWSDETFRIFQCDPGTKPTVEFVLSRVHSEDRQLVQQQIERASRNGEGFDFEHRLQLPDGCIKHVRVTAHPSRDSAGNFEFVGAVSDISEQRRAEAVIREQERELRDAIDTIPALVWSALPDGSNTYVNKRFMEYTGSSAEHTAGSGWQALVHPDDLERHAGKWMEAVATGKPHESEVRSRRADGQYRWQLDRGAPLRDEHGNIVKWYGVTTDIEDRKQAEDKIREQEIELRQMLDLTPQQVAVYGPNGERLYANRVALDYVGLSLEEWRETSGGFLRPSSFIHPDDSERVKACGDRVLTSGSAYEVEVRLRKHDGSYRWFLSRFNPVRDDKGQIMRWYVAGTDIEDRKRAEEKLQQENAALRDEINQTSMFEEIVGNSPALKAVLSRISKVAPSDSTVLITGETGTGKELVARAIHRRSRRSSRAFVSVNCAAIPRDLIASELFGHEKGAFTGAMQRRIGRFELADGGTIFLDEVGELLPDTQAALLRVLQEREFERIGGSQTIHVDVRVVAATNRDLNLAVANGTLRQDLFYRLNVFPIEVPPLRKRKDDTLLLVEYFVQRYAARAGKRIRSIDKKTLDLLQSYDWPGNIRELQNVIERFVILSPGEVLSGDELWLSKEAAMPASPVEAPPAVRGEVEPRSEREIIEAALAEARGRISGPSGAAARLGVPPSTLDYRIKTLRIDKRRFKFV